MGRSVEFNRENGNPDRHFIVVSGDGDIRQVDTTKSEGIKSPELLDPTEIVFELKGVSGWYGDYPAVKGVEMKIADGKITAFIGPSGCGKSTILRILNRMHELTAKAHVEGQVTFYRQGYPAENLYDPDIDPVEVRRRIGMVFQKPNPFPKSIYDNVAYGPRILGVRDKKTLDEIVEASLTNAALWDEVKDDLKKSGLALSGGQQQRLCIARTIAVEPEIILMDEPCSALDPIATQRIEELMKQLAHTYTIIIVTHNMQQAIRVSDYTAFFNIRKDQRADKKGRIQETRSGVLEEYNTTDQIFHNPQKQATKDYISGRFG